MSVIKPNLKDPEQIRLYNIVDMGLTFSAMIRLFEKGSKPILRRQITASLQRLPKVNSKDDYFSIHREFCLWGTKNLKLAEKWRNGRRIKEKKPASFGQVAKTYDVVLTVVVYYSKWPDAHTSDMISKWINAAVDNKMMKFLKKEYPDGFNSWPISMEDVNEARYNKLQGLVMRFINEKHEGRIHPVQFGDIYWNVLNRKFDLDTNRGK
jgi:hypothetical protein